MIVTPDGLARTLGAHQRLALGADVGAASRKHPRES